VIRRKASRPATAETVNGPQASERPAEGLRGKATTKPLASTTLSIDRIRVGERHRKDMGDIDGLAASIADIGLLNPITVDDRDRLLAGARRLAACKLLGLETIEVKIVRCGDESASDDMRGGVR
jgi:hypothetical protein